MISIPVIIFYLIILNTFEHAYILSILFFITMLLSTSIMTLIKKYIKPKYNMIISILITLILVTLEELFVSRYIPVFYKEVGIYLPLMMLCVYDYDNGNIKKDIITSLKYVVLILVIVLIKEVIGTGTLTLLSSLTKLTGYRAIYNIPANNFIPINIVNTIPGSLILVGVGLAIFNKFKGGKNA